MSVHETRERLFGRGRPPLSHAVVDQPSNVASTVPSHSATRGLFGHIQSNNFRSIVVFAVFLALIQMLQFAVMILVAQPGQGRQFAAPLLSSELISPMASMSEVAAELKGKLIATSPAESLLERTWSDLELIWNGLITRGGLFEGRTLWILLPALLYVICGAWFAAIFVRRQVGAHRIARADEPRLYRVVEKLAIARGLPMPSIEVVESRGRNAYAGGFHPRNSVVGVSRGLLEALNDAELEAVLAHEIAHIEARDNRLMTLANLCTGAVASVGRNLLQSAKDNPLGIGITIIVFAFFVPAIKSVLFVTLVFGTWCIAELMRRLISKKREFIADARAIEIMKSPAALISALRKVAANDRIDGLTPEVQAMMISNLSDIGAGTHPSIDARVRAIEETTTVNWADVEAIARQPAPMESAIFDRRREARPAKASTSQGSIENEKLEDVFKLLVGLDRMLVSTAKGVVKVLTYAPFLSWLVIPIALLAAIVSGLTGLSATTSLVIVGAVAVVWWRRPKRAG